MSNAESYLTVTGIVVLTIYFLPAIVASARLHRQTMAIVVLDLLLGWTLLGWIAALVWACTADTRPPKPATSTPKAKAPTPAKLNFAKAFPAQRPAAPAPRVGGLFGSESRKRHFARTWHA